MNFVEDGGSDASAERPSGCQGSVAFRMSAIVGTTSMLCTLRSLTTGILLAGQLDEERHRHDVGECLPIDAFERSAWAEAHAVIAGYDDQRLVVEPFGFQPAGDTPDDRVHVLQLQQVLPVGLDDGPRLATPAAAALQAVEHAGPR